MSAASQPKARFHTRINESDFLAIAVWRGKADPTAEVITVQIRRREGDEWKTVGRLAVYRTAEGAYRELPNRPRS